MTYLHQILSDLREKRLWPVAAVLIIALVAVPTLLAKSSSQTPIAPLPRSPSSAAAPSTAVPAVSVETTSTNSNLKGRGRDPFRQQKLPAAASTAKTATTAKTAKTSSSESTGGSTGAKTSTGTAATTGTGGGGTGSGTGSGSTPSTLPTTKPKPAPTGLTATQAYSVSIAITNSSGGFDAVDPLARLSPVPNRQQPLLVELGVLRGGRRVLFAVQPGTVVRGGGTCVPGPVDCELISLAPGTVESIYPPASTSVAAVAQYTVTAIGVDRYASAAAAGKGRRTESAVGRRLLNDSTLNVLPLFQYNASLGAVVDLRNLTVGGT